MRDNCLDEVVSKIVERTTELAHKRSRNVYLCTTVQGDHAITLSEVNPHTNEGRERLIGYLRAHPQNYYFLDNLGMPDERNRICWFEVYEPKYQRVQDWIITGIAYFMINCKLKNRLLRWAGVEVHPDAEIAFGTLIDPFCFELIKIGKYSNIGTGSKLFSHGYVGLGKLVFGMVDIGERCLIGANSMVGPGIQIEDGGGCKPGVVLSGYVTHVDAGVVYGVAQPTTKRKENVTMGQ